MLTQTVCI